MKDMLVPVQFDGFDHILKPKKDFKLDQSNRYYDLVCGSNDAISNDSSVMYEGGGARKS